MGAVEFERFTARDFHEIYEVRLDAGAEAFRLAALTPRPADLKKLRENFRQMERARIVESSDAAGYRVS